MNRRFLLSFFTSVVVTGFVPILAMEKAQEQLGFAFDQEKLSQQIQEDNFGQTIPIPEELEQFAEQNGVQVVQLEVEKQDGPTCALYALFNLRAAQQLLQYGKPITSENLTGIVHEQWVPWLKENAKTLQKKGLIRKQDNSQRRAFEEDQRIQWCTKFADTIGLNNVCSIKGRACTGGNIFDDKIKVHYCTPTYSQVQTFRQLLNEAGECEFFVLPFQVSISGDNDSHSVSVLFCKIPHQKSLIIYLDSNNISLNSPNGSYTHNAYSFLDFLINPENVYSRLLFRLSNAEKPFLIPYVLKYLRENKMEAEIKEKTVNALVVFLESMANEGDFDEQWGTVWFLLANKAYEIDGLKERIIAPTIKLLEKICKCKDINDNVVRLVCSLFKYEAYEIDGLKERVVGLMIQLVETVTAGGSSFEKESVLDGLLYNKAYNINEFKEPMAKLLKTIVDHGGIESTNARDYLAWFFNSRAYEVDGLEKKVKEAMAQCLKVVVHKHKNDIGFLENLLYRKAYEIDGLKEVVVETMKVLLENAACGITQRKQVRDDAQDGGLLMALEGSRVYKIEELKDSIAHYAKKVRAEGDIFAWTRAEGLLEKCQSSSKKRKCEEMEEVAENVEEQIEQLGAIGL